MSQETQKEREVQLVIFRLSQEFYGLGIDVVQEIVTRREVTRLPSAPPFVSGIINLRGRVIPVIDLGMRLGLARSEDGDATRIMVVEIAERVVGFVVDEVSEVLRVPLEQIDSPEAIMTGNVPTLLRGVAKVDERLVLLLDPLHLLAEM